MEKAHSRIKWQNYPSIATPLNETNLNKMDIALDEVDNRVLGLDTAKLDKATANTMVKDISFNEKTGIFTITLLNGTKKTIDTKLEKIATNFSYNYETQKLNLTLADGTVQEIDMSSLISQYEFTDGEIVSFSVDNGKVSAIVKDGSVTEEKLQPNFLADVKTEVAKAKSSSDSAYENATTARESADEAKQSRDEAKQFRDEAEAVSGVTIATTEKAGLVRPDGTTIRVDEDGTIHADAGTIDYTELENKPTINGVELKGNLTSEDLDLNSDNIVYLTQAEYDALPDSKLTDGIEYRITDAGIESTARNIAYDNTNSGIEAVNVQGAIDEIAESLTLNFASGMVGATEYTMPEPNGYVDIPVSFNKTLSKNPIITTNIAVSSGNNVYSLLVPQVLHASVSPNGFTIRLWNNSNTAIAARINWIAIV